MLEWMFWALFTALAWMMAMNSSLMAYMLLFQWRELFGMELEYTQQDIDRLRYEAMWQQYLLNQESKYG